MELEFNYLNYDNGYGMQDGDLIVEVEPIYTNESFTAHGIGGGLQNFNRTELTDCEFLGATFFIIDQDGGNIGQVEFDCIEDLTQFGITKETLIDELNK